VIKIAIVSMLYGMHIEI